MIKTYKDYLIYLEADRISLNMDKTLKNILFDDIWKFQRLMRRLEYLTNSNKNIAYRIFTSYQYRKLSIKLGFSIPINVFGPGLSIAHRGTIVVNSKAKVGCNCRLHVCVNIGTQAGKETLAPTLGNNCYIAPGVKIFGDILLGDNMALAANAVVNKSFPDGNATLGGIPAKIISNKTSDGLLITGFKITKERL